MKRHCIFINNYKQLEKAYSQYFKEPVRACWLMKGMGPNCAGEDAIKDGIVLYHYYDIDEKEEILDMNSRIHWDRQADVEVKLKRIYKEEIIYMSNLMETE